VPYNWLLLPLLGGFLFFHITHYFRFSAQRLDGYRLLFQTAIAGTCLGFLARLVTLTIELIAGPDALTWFWSRFAPFPFSGTSTLSLLLGPLLALAVNLFINTDRAKDIEIRRHGNALTKLLHRAQKENSLVSITLDSRKWYVGWVTESPNLDPQELYFRLLPFTSGYRDQQDLEPVRTVFYDAALNGKGVNRNDLYITLPLKDVKIANLFSEDLYNDYFAEPPPAGENPVPTHRHHGQS
jgi:hypothetical protein